MHRILAFLTITLFVFNFLIPSFAQELSVQEQAEWDAIADTDSTSRGGYTMCGICFGSAALVLGGNIGYRIGSTINNVPTSSYDWPSDEQLIGCITGAALLGGVAAPLLLYFGPYPSPPPERLIGKSPAYVEAYTEAYQKPRKKYALLGSLVVGLPIDAIGLLTLWVYSYSE